MMDDINRSRNRSGPFPMCPCGHRVDQHSTAKEGKIPGNDPGCWLCLCEEPRPARSRK